MSARAIVRIAIGTAVIVVAAVGASVSGHVFATAIKLRHEGHPQTTWAACNRNAYNDKPSTFKPLSGAAARALVTPEPETRPDNGRKYTFDGHLYPAPNDYVPTNLQVSHFVHATLITGETNTQFNPYYEYVDGRDGMHHPSTDDLIQWAAHKWGIPEDWLRAEYVYESYWNQFMLGDNTPISASAYKRYPAFARVPGKLAAYQSLGITQVRWIPDNSLHPGTEPLRWLSTAYNLDYAGATLRFYYDNPQGSRTAWNDASYKPCQRWNSVGAWFSPYPWNNSGQTGYVKAVKGILAGREWTAADFVHWSPASLPPGIKLR